MNEREKAYGETWRLPGRIVRVIMPELNQLSLQFPELWWPWVAILVKLVRLLASPQKRDNWEDIVGYANLALSDLPKEACHARK